MEQEVQSHLLRLSVLLATSLSTLSEPVAPTIVTDEAAAPKSSADLSKQIIGDLQTLITAVQKSCTNLTLALRPSTHAMASTLSPIGGLDAASLEAAKAQIVSITNDSVPKLVFLARKAVSEATLHRYVAKTADDLEREKAELEFVKSKGGHVVQPAYARESEKLEKIKGRGLGKAWSKSIVATVFELFEALGELSRAYMNARTRTVLQKAQEARDKADGITNGNRSKGAADDALSDPKKARQAAMQATGVVWEVCDAALKGKSKLVADNRSAVSASWKRRTDVLKDAMREFSEALDEKEENNANHGEGGDEDDALAGLEDMQLTDGEKEQARKYVPLLKSCCQLHAKVGAVYLVSSKADADADQVDLDNLDLAGEAIAEGVDDLVAALLYGGDLDGEDDGEEENEETEDEAIEAVEQIVEASHRLYAEATSGAKLTDLDELWATLRKTAAHIIG